ncbi:MAG: hypothetical protein AAGF23_09255 [Acidobacteriota bacterium]
MRTPLRRRLHPAPAGAASTAAVLLLLWTAGASPCRGQDGGESGEPATESVESGEPAVLSEAGEPAATSVPLYDPNAPELGEVPLFDPDAPVPLFDPGTPAPAYDPDAPVPLFEPGGVGNAGFGDVEPFDLDGGPAGDPAGDPEWRPAGVDAEFDFAAARKLLATEMTTPGDLASPDEVLEVVEAGELDGDLGATGLRGANELGLDLRSVERFRWECRNEISRRDVTLFGNGTVRLRRGPRGRQDLQLDELERELLLEYLSRLARIQRSRALRHDVAGGQDFGQVDGELGEACLIQLRLPDLPPVSLTAPRLEVPQLGLAQLIAVADELAAFTRPLAVPERVAASYDPKPGDRLKRRDGFVYRVVGLTGDGAGVELEGLQEPIRVFYRVEDLPTLFERFEGEWDGEPAEVSEPEVREIVDLGGGG